MAISGNDIIALSAIDVARTNTPRFYTKILTESEQQLFHGLHGAIPFHYFVWLLWSVKEAAYKCLQRQQPDLVFSPVGTVITSVKAPHVVSPAFSSFIESTGFTDAHCFISEVKFNSYTLYARSIIYGDELIHSVASFDPDPSVTNWGLQQIQNADPESQSSAVREFLIARLKPMHPAAVVTVDKNPSGIPFILIDGEELPVSLSHHDKWVGYSF